MSKEYLEALDEFLKDYLFLCEKLHTNMQEKMLLDGNSPYNVLKTYLEAIDNSNHSEALECLKHIKKYYIPEPCSAKTYDCLETIKQALLKAQENARSEEILQKYYQEGITLDSVRALKLRIEALEKDLEEQRELAKHYLEEQEKEIIELRQKAQEPKQYLKWEDLEFDNNAEVKKYLKVKLGENIYSAFYHYSFLINCEMFCIARDTLNLYITDKQFFNDLHLERVEE